MTSVLFSPLLQPLPMNLSSPATLTFISIILQTLSPLSFCHSFLVSILVIMSPSLRTTNNILDLVITSSDPSLAPAVSCTHRSPSDHFPVFTRLSINPAPLPPPTLHSFRRLHSIDIGSFLTDLILLAHIRSPEITWTCPVCLQHTLSSLLDKHAPIVSKLSRRQSPSNPWFTATLRVFRSTLRHVENI